MLPSVRRRTQTAVRHLAGLAALVLLAGIATPLSAYNPNQPQGFDADRMYHQAAALPDQVDLFSGRLSVTLPIGPFTLVYNNNVWRYRDVIEKGQPKIQVWPDRLQNAGLGWHLGWGELYPPGHWYNDSVANQWLYVDDSGARHFFYGALHRLENDGDGDVYYTRDNTYLRLRKIVAGLTWHIELPDGTTRRFVKGGPGQPYRLTSAWGPHGSAGDPDLTITYGPDDKLRTVTDRHGRNHYVHLAGGDDIIDGNDLSWMVRVITKVDVQGPEGQRLEYDFSYRNIPVDVSCKETSQEFGPRRRLPHLVRIDLPDGTAYEMQEADTTPSYINTCPAGIDDAPGSLTRMQLPAGGELRWTYQEYEFPPGDNWGPFNTSAGVATREARDIGDNVVGSWTYKSRGFGATAEDDPEMRTDVVALPEGDCSRHYFSAIYYQSPAQGKGWEYGLPFVKRVEEEERYLSSEVYTDHNAATGLCSGTKLRSTYVRFRHDPIPGAGTVDTDPGCQFTSPCSRLDEWYNTNRTLDATRTVFHDDPIDANDDHWVDTELSQFDGIGNFRKTVTTGNFWSGSTNDERRETLTNYTRSPGTFPGGGYSHPSTTDPWILGVFNRADVSEPDAEGETASRVEYDFDDTTGDLLCTRTLVSGLGRALEDVVVTFEYDARGNPTDVKTYGGDADPLTSTAGDGCGDLPADPVYWTHHEYDYDVLARTKPYQPDGTPGAFPTYDVTVDPSSGVVLSSRSPSGFETSYDYDAAGRLTTMTPEAGASLTTTVTNPTATETAKVYAVVALGTEIFREEEEVLDSFGREVEKRRRMPDGTWASRHRMLNVRGWLLEASEWNAPSVVSRYLEHDPFGRPGRITPPEGTSHDTEISYQGIRAVTVSAPVLTTIAAAEVSSSRTHHLDRYGRLRTVLEPAGAAGTDATTFYLYDVGGRMTQITSEGILGWTDPPDPQPIIAQQVRSYDFDNRGFLLSEKHPEKGLAGNGTVTYSGYDAAGNVGSMVDHDHELSFEYDFMGRQTEVKDVTANPERTLRSFVYDTAVGLGSAKVHEATAFNYLKVPASGLPFTVEVTQRYSYDGLGGRVDAKETIYGLASGTYTMRSELDYDDAGDVIRIDYPQCVSGCDVPRQQFPTTGSFAVDLGRSYGAVTGVPGWADGVEYHPSGLWSRIDHANGVSDFQERDPFHRARSARIYSEDAAETVLWDSGAMSYDGSGNLTAAGTNLYAYDLVGRLSESRGDVASIYGYDVFGNLLSRTPFSLDPETYSFPVDPETNRLANATYDGAGNVLAFYGQIFAYDPFDRLINQAQMAYAYDAFGERAASFAANSIAPYFHLRGLDHELLTTIYFDGDTTFDRQEDYVYLLGRPLGVRRRGTGHEHYHLDHLGTQKLRTTAYGGGTAYSLVSPYGVEMPGSQIDNRLFTGHERDFSTDTDYMHARHYYSEMGRFLSVDSFRGNPAIPQSLNRYAYVTGNPINRVDPDGHAGGSSDGVAAYIESGLKISDWAAQSIDNPILSGGLTAASGGGTVTLGTLGLAKVGGETAATCSAGGSCAFMIGAFLASAEEAAEVIDMGFGKIGDGYATMLFDPFPWELDQSVPTSVAYEVTNRLGGTGMRFTGFTGDEATPLGFKQSMTVTARSTPLRRFWQTIRQFLKAKIDLSSSPDIVVELRNSRAMWELREFGNRINYGLLFGPSHGSHQTPFCDASGVCRVYYLSPPAK